MATSETTTRILFALVGALAAALVVVLVVLFTGGDDPTEPAAEPGVTEPAPAPSEEPDTSGDADLAAFVQLTVDNVADITKSDWDIDPGAEEADIGLGFCGQPLETGAVPVSQATHHLLVDGPGTLPRVTTLGTVFPNEAAAQEYMAARAASDSCGEWTNQDDVVLEVTEPPSTPTLVGCRCQEVQLHRVDAYLPGSDVHAQYTIVARQGRFVSMAFYTIDESVATSPDALQMVAELQDRLVERVNEIATTN
ncbi:MAG TPA: hypothetical protein VNZ66_04960 [Aeromicrobium sp.]|nr:hypothetical protein [Aeromicrobium sp.]